VATRRFLKHLKGLEEKTRERVLRAMEEIVQKPYTGSLLVFDERRLYKRRVGNYRVIYEIDEMGKRVLFHIVHHRKKMYREFGS